MKKLAKIYPYNFLNMCDGYMAFNRNSWKSDLRTLLIFSADETIREQKLDKRRFEKFQLSVDNCDRRFDLNVKFYFQQIFSSLVRALNISKPKEINIDEIFFFIDHFLAHSTVISFSKPHFLRTINGIAFFIKASHLKLNAIRFYRPFITFRSFIIVNHW